jgi:hypothetical protein
MEKEPRNPIIVISNILQNVPDDKIEFKEDLKDFIKKDLVYRAPEMVSHPTVWMKFETIMKKHIYDFDEPWKKICVDIYTDQQTS